MCCAHSLLYILALCGSSVRDGIADACSNDDSQSRVHGSIGEGSVCSVTMYCEFETDHSTFASLERMCLVTFCVRDACHGRDIEGRR